jgi:hypothetical protein
MSDSMVHLCHCCGAVFKSYEGLRTHIGMLHKVAGTYPFQCGCDQRFGCEAALYKHRGLGQCRIQKNLQGGGRSWTLDEARLEFPETWTRYLDICYRSKEAIRQPLTSCQVSELTLAYWTVRNGVSQKGHAELVELLPLISPSETVAKTANLKTIFDRIERGGYYPSTPWDRGAGCFSVEVPVNSDQHIQSDSDPAGAITISAMDMLFSLTESLFDREVIGDETNPYVLNADVRFDGEDREYHTLASGTWWEDTEKKINRGVLGGTSKVFPITIYIDETHLTREGTFTAKPFYAQAGNPRLQSSVVRLVRKHYLTAAAPVLQGYSTITAARGTSRGNVWVISRLSILRGLRAIVLVDVTTS